MTTKAKLKNEPPTCGNTLLPAVVRGGDIPAYGINKIINFREDGKFSPNLYKFLTYGNKHLTNVFQDPKTGYYYIGLRDKNGIFIGAMLMRVFCVGNDAETFSMATSITKTWSEVTDWFWRKYLEVGKKIYDLPEWGALAQ
jgi:hypothetical protein